MKSNHIGAPSILTLSQLASETYHIMFINETTLPSSLNIDKF